MAAVLQPFVDDHTIGGAVVLIANKDKVLDLEAVGYSSVESLRPMQTDAEFWIASMTKSITATALMMLVQEGKVDISAPVEKYLPEFKGQQVADEKEPTKLRAPAHPITVREVMSHTSGLVVASDPRARSKQVLKDDVALYASVPLIREPGTKYQYNNCGINTGGRIIEVVSGMPYEQFVRTRLLEPLGMKDATFWPDANQGARLANTFRAKEDNSGLEDLHFDKDITQKLIDRLAPGIPVPQPLLANFGIGALTDYGKHYAMPAGGLYCTASDLAPLCQMLLNGGTYHGKALLTSDAVRQMTSSQTNGVAVSPVESYGLGWSTKIKADEGLPAGSFGHRGARKTMMWMDPAHDLAVVFMVQSFNIKGPQAKALYTACLKAAEEKFASSTPAP